MILTIAAFYILNNLFPANIAKIYINIRHGNTLRIQKALKEQIVFKWIQIRNSQSIGHNAARSRATARPNRDFHTAGIIDKIPHNEEIAVKAHAVDNSQLVLQPVLDLLSNLRILFRQVIGAELPEIHFVRHTLRQRELWQVPMFKIKFHMAPLGDFHRIGNSLRIFFKDGCHLFRRF